MTMLALLGSMYMLKENDGDSQICVGTAQSLRAPFPPVPEKWFSVVVYSAAITVLPFSRVVSASARKKSTCPARFQDPTVGLGSSFL